MCTNSLVIAVTAITTIRHTYALTCVQIHLL
jgi:hypothetical protein